MAPGYIKMRRVNQERVIGQLGFYYNAYGCYKRDNHTADVFDSDYITCRITDGRMFWEKHSGGPSGRLVAGYITHEKMTFDEIFEELTQEQQDVAIFNLDLLR